MLLRVCLKAPAPTRLFRVAYVIALRLELPFIGVSRALLAQNPPKPPKTSQKSLPGASGWSFQKVFRRVEKSQEVSKREREREREKKKRREKENKRKKKRGERKKTKRKKIEIERERKTKNERDWFDTFLRGAV